MSNIKVYLRIKPHIKEEEIEVDSEEVQDNNISDEEIEKQGENGKEGRKELSMKIKKTDNNGKLYLYSKTQRTKIFTFDRIFEDQTTQTDVYSTLKDDLISSSMNGVRKPILIIGSSTTV